LILEFEGARISEEFFSFPCSFYFSTSWAKDDFDNSEFGIQAFYVLST